MGYLISLSGSAKGCAVTPTVGRKYTSKEGDKYWVDMDLLESYGFDGFISIDCSYSGLLIDCVAFGMNTCIQVSLPYPWSKHELVSNVPIESYCKNGYLESAFHAVKYYFKSLIK